MAKCVHKIALKKSMFSSFYVLCVYTFLHFFFKVISWTNKAI